MTTSRIVRPLPVLVFASLLVACPSGGDDPMEPEDLVINTSSLPAAAVGEAYTAGVDAEGGDGEYTWDVPQGDLPPGLDLSIEDLTDDDVLITGVPVQEGTFDFVLRVQSEDGQARTRAYSITVIGDPDPITIERTIVPPALAGAGYTTRLVASGGDGENFEWEVASGTLPPGLEIEGDSIVGNATTPDTTVVVLRVSSGGFEAEEPFTFRVVANRTSTFDLTIFPVVPVPAAVQPALDAAVARWQEIIVGDLAQAAVSVGFFDPGQCLGFGPVLNGTSADDIIIMVNIAPIDGPGQVLGQATPCVVRGNVLPFAGILTLDSEDLLTLINNGGSGVQDVVNLFLHEIGHILGFGSLWDFGSNDFLIPSTSDPRFDGPGAVDEWQDLGGTGDVPVENEGGAGTRDSHWRESVFGTEVMTGFSNIGSFQAMSRVSIASLDDMGYTVDLGAADPYVLPAPGSAMRSAGTAYGWDEVPDITIRRIGEP